jgi:NTE family protein
MAEEHRADGVFQGGGVKGLGLVGALLEFAGGKAKDAEGKPFQITEWVNVAGTSAGSIVASLLAVGKTPAELRDIFMNHLDFTQFEDWGPGGEFIGGGLNLAMHHGLAHGKVFHDWIDGQLGHATFADVRAPKAHTTTGSPYRLRMIAADITNHRMLVLPDDIVKYTDPKTDRPFVPDDMKIADAVRMSMSIPYFFQPIVLTAADDGTKSTIVDGGVLSNFPVWLFDTQSTTPVRPTFGFHLTGGRGVGGGLQTVIHDLGWAVEEAVDIFHTATDAWDQRFMSHSTVVRTCSISAGTIGTTDFTMTEAQKEWLLQSGADGVTTFLGTYTPAHYMNTYGNKLV